MKKPTLSFCIPVMNRLSDLQSTLRKNLDDNSQESDLVEFIVVCFDKDETTFNWVTNNFPHEIATEYLRVYRSDLLTEWHFGRAKNAFKDLIRGRIYASLDGDNFTGKHGGRHIIDVFEENDYECVFHQFQGKWGDGTCGRISLTRDDYITFGYDDNFLPRQWDELDALLSPLVNNQPRKYICYREKSITKISHPFKRYLSENNIALEVVELDSKSDPLVQEKSEVAVGQHDNNYVEDDLRLKYSSIFNHLTSFFKNTKEEFLRNRYSEELVETQRQMIEGIETAILMKWFLIPQVGIPAILAQDIVLVSCTKNEADLASWQNHYRDLGVTKFLLIDDFSDVPVASVIDHNDTWVWRPKCGKFRYSKAFWLELLLQNFCVGNWAVCVDSDEYLDVPNFPLNHRKDKPLSKLVAYATEENLYYFCGFLVDLAPKSSAYETIARGELLAQKEFTRYQFRPQQKFGKFTNHNTVKWSYGDSAHWAYRLDLRFRLNRAFDSLRKFPILFVEKNIHLNQGFHDLIIQGQKRSAKDMRRNDLLPILHFKLFNTQIDAISPGNRPSNAYHAETKVNLDRLRGGINRTLRQACASPYNFEYLSYNLIPVPSVQSIRLQVVDYNKETAPRFRDVVNRQCSIPVVLFSGEPEFRHGAIYAESLDAAARWVSINTPFSSPLYRNDVTIELSTSS